MNDYIFEKHADDPERARLVLIERACDAATHAWLERAGVEAGQRCLEIGAGAGSILRWLAERVGPEGRAVGIDRSTRHVGDAAVEGDILELEAEPFDLVHCRYVLIHNREREAILRKIRGLLKPGGAAVLEEPDFTTTSGGPVNEAICAMFESMELDPGFGARLAEAAKGAGFGHVEAETEVHEENGGGPIARVMAASAVALREKYAATGKATAEDVDGYIRNALDPAVRAVHYATVRVLAR